MNNVGISYITLINDNLILINLNKSKLYHIYYLRISVFHKSYKH